MSIEPPFDFDCGFRHLQNHVMRVAPPSTISVTPNVRGGRLARKTATLANWRAHASHR
jgi:hypothetical protein